MKLEQMKFQVQIWELVGSPQKHCLFPSWDYFWKCILEYFDDWYLIFPSSPQQSYLSWNKSMIGIRMKEKVY